MEVNRMNEEQKQLKEVVWIHPTDMKKIKNIYPDDFPKQYFDAYIELIKQYVFENKENHQSKSMRFLDDEEQKLFIFATFSDAIKVRPTFLECFPQ